MPNAFDRSDYPLLRVRAYGSSSNDEVAERIAFLAEHLEGEGIVLLLDNRDIETPAPSARRLWVEWLLAHRDAIARGCDGAAFVVSDARVRGVYTAVFWFWTPPFPYLITADIDEAEAWVRNRVGRAA